MDYFDYIETLDVCEKKICNLIQTYKMFPESNQLDGYAQKILRELYEKTIKILDLKKAAEGSLTDVEQKIYKKCKKELETKNLKGIIKLIGGTLGCLIDAYESILHILPWGRKEAEVQHLLFRAGEEVLPGYIGFLSTLVETYEFFVTLLDVAELAEFGSMHTASKLAAEKYRVNYQEVNKALAQDMLRCADFGYTGKEKYQDYIPFRSEELPQEFRAVYNSQNGLFDPGRGLKVWLAQNKNEIVVAFSGTDNMIKIYEDYVQAWTNSALYLEAAGFLRIMLKEFKNQKFLVTGHSLGGGLAQFSVTANINECENRIRCYAFNSAGLSLKSLDILKEERLNKAREYIRVYVTSKDIVSIFGAQLGTIVALKKVDGSNNGHSMNALYKSMIQYLEEDDLRSLQTEQSTIFDILQCDSSKLSSWKSAKCYSNNGEIKYDIFECNDMDKSNIMQVSLYKTIIREIRNTDKTKESRFGIYEYFNGDSFTVINRLLILQEGNPIKKLELTREWAASIAFFGPYGYGTKEWINNMLDVLQTENSPISRERFDVYFSRVANEYQLMLEAWLYVFKNIYGYDFYHYFEKFDTTKESAIRLLMRYQEKSNTLYRKYNFNRSLLKEEYKEYIDKKYELFSDLLDAAEKLAVDYEMMKEIQFEAVKKNILSYLRSFIDSLIREEKQIL